MYVFHSLGQPQLGLTAIFFYDDCSVTHCFTAIRMAHAENSRAKRKDFMYSWQRWCLNYNKRCCLLFLEMVQDFAWGFCRNYINISH